MRLEFTRVALAAGLIISIPARDAIANSPPPLPPPGTTFIETLKRLGSQGSLSNVEWAGAALGAKFTRTNVSKLGDSYDVYEPLPIIQETGRGDVRSVLPFPDHLDLFQRLRFDYRIDNTGYIGPVHNWDKSCIAIMAFYDIEEWECITSFEISQIFSSSFRLKNKIGRVCGQYPLPEYTYGYSLQHDGGIETDFLIWGPDRGQDGCAQHVALVERRPN